jgi:predicted ribosome quality control (RQC) complex YloA/Tae2 family protein
MISSKPGTPTHRATGNVLKRVSNSPLYQKEIQKALNVSPDKRAVSGINRALGRGIAMEQSKLARSDQAGEQLARRRDKLAFSKKLLDDKKSRWSEQNKLRKSILDYEEGQLGLEVGLGLAGVGTSFWRRKENQKQHAEWMTEFRSFLASFKKGDN